MISGVLTLHIIFAAADRELVSLWECLQNSNLVQFARKRYAANLLQLVFVSFGCLHFYVCGCCCRFCWLFFVPCLERLWLLNYFNR